MLFVLNHSIFCSIISLSLTQLEKRCFHGRRLLQTNFF
nr:MAG TPA: hypothetical protein [Caudoviricetes sp.]